MSSKSKIKLNYNINHMCNAVFYARVSSEMQKREGTIQSQILSLKNQIAQNGDLLVKQYIDDGYTGAYMDRPALHEFLFDLTTNLFDAVSDPLTSVKIKATPTQSQTSLFTSS